MITKVYKSIFMAVLTIGMFGCATHIAKPAALAEPSKVKLSTYDHVYMKDVGISDKFADSSANQKALKKIDEVMYTNLKMVFPGLQRVSAQEIDKKQDQKTLVIEPQVKEIKFIGGATRFWVGAMAGSSAVLMQAKFTDANTGDVLATPEFYRDANAMAGAWSMGGADNGMLEMIAQDVVNYAAMNR